MVTRDSTTGSQYSPAIASDPEGDFVVVFGQRFAGPGLALSADGSCPGLVTATISNAPPNSEVGIWKAENTNGFVKGGRLCNGTEFEIGEPFQLPPTWVIVDGEGNGTTTLDLGRKGCNLEALSLATCETSNTVQVP